MLWTGPSLREDGKATHYTITSQPYLQLEEAGGGRRESILKAGGAKKRKCSFQNSSYTKASVIILFGIKLQVLQTQNRCELSAGFPPINPGWRINTNLLRLQIIKRNQISRWWNTIKYQKSRASKHSPIYNSQNMEAAWMSIKWGTDKDAAALSNGVSLRCKQELDSVTCRDVDGSRYRHSELSQKNICVLMLTHRIQKNEPNCKAQRHKYRELTDIKWGRGMGCTGRLRLPYIHHWY